MPTSPNPPCKCSTLKNCSPPRFKHPIATGTCFCLFSLALPHSRIIVSDGTHFIQGFFYFHPPPPGMLATQCNQHVLNENVKNYSIVRINEMVVNSVQSRRYQFNLSTLKLQHHHRLEFGTGGPRRSQNWQSCECGRQRCQSTSSSSKYQ